MRAKQRTFINIVNIRKKAVRARYAGGDGRADERTEAMTYLMITRVRHDNNNNNNNNCAPRFYIKTTIISDLPTKLDRPFFNAQKHILEKDMNIVMKKIGLFSAATMSNILPLIQIKI